MNYKFTSKQREAVILLLYFVSLIMYIPDRFKSVIENKIKIINRLRCIDIRRQLSKNLIPVLLTEQIFLKLFFVFFKKTKTIGK